MSLELIEPMELVLMILIPTVTFIIGFLFGKEAGYVKRIKEKEEER